MTRNSGLIALLFLGAGLALQASADDKHHPQAATARVATAATTSALTEGEVRKVDKAAGKVTLKHGAMPKFDMPPMTMTYRVKDKAMLDGLRPGDKIKFDVDGAGGEFTVLHLEKMN